jgi:hypothetical protein
MDTVGVISDSMLGVVLMTACELLTVLLPHAANKLRIRGVDQVL